MAYRSTALRVLTDIQSLFSKPLFRVGDSLLSGNPAEAHRHLGDFEDDPISLEGFANHYHIDDYLEGLRLDSRSKRRVADRLADSVMRVWYERMIHLLDGSSVLFFVGGEEDVILRFHLERNGKRPWAPLDSSALKKSRVRVFRATAERLERIV